MSGRLRAAGWSVLFLAGGVALSIPALRWLSGMMPPGRRGPLAVAGLQTLVLLAIFGALTWLIGSRVLRLPAAAYGVVPVGRGVRRFGWGLGLGLGLGALAMAVAVPAGGALWREDGGSLPAWLGTVGRTALVLLPAALVEELMFRGVPMVALSRAFGRAPAVIVLATLFGLGHLLNPGVTPLAVLNIIVAGIWLGAVFFTPGGLWTATGAHAGWNLALAALAAPVSGLPFPMPWLDYAPGGPAWLTGGGFGPEGGVLATLCLTGGLWMASRGTREDPAA